MKDNEHQKLIHIGKYRHPNQGKKYLFLKKHSPSHFIWYESENNHEKKTEVSGSTIEEAIKHAHRTWKHHSFQTLGCGFRYTLPDRDEHGINALFCDMAASYRNPSGVYFDEDLGHHCRVDYASKEALDLLKKLNA